MTHRGSRSTPRDQARRAAHHRGRARRYFRCRPDQAAHKLCDNIPEDKKANYLELGVGHYGAFNGSRFRSEIAPRISDHLVAQRPRKRRQAQGARRARSGRGRQPQPRDFRLFLRRGLAVGVVGPERRCVDRDQQRRGCGARGAPAIFGSPRTGIAVRIPYHRPGVPVVSRSVRVRHMFIGGASSSAKSRRGACPRERDLPFRLRLCPGPSARLASAFTNGPRGTARSRTSVRAGRSCRGSARPAAGRSTASARKRRDR